VTVRVVGDVDMDTAGMLAAQLDRAVAGYPGDVTVDLAGVTFLDSTGRREPRRKPPRSNGGADAGSVEGRHVVEVEWVGYGTMSIRSQGSHPGCLAVLAAFEISLAPVSRLLRPASWVIGQPIGACRRMP